MANRPCKPDGDFKKLWQTLMPGVALPACGTGAHDPAAPERAGPAQPRDDATPKEEG